MDTGSRISLAIVLISLVISGISLGFSVYSWNVLNNYQPSVEIRGTSHLIMDEKCSLANQTMKDCTLTGNFNLSLGIISPQAGVYNISIVSFSPAPAFMYSLTNTSFLGKNLTLIYFVVGNGGYSIKVRNETSGHFIYYENIGAQPPGGSFFTTPMEIVENPESNVPANGFEKTIVVPVRSTDVRPVNYNGTSSPVRIGTLTGILTYTELPTNQSIQKPFVIEVWMQTSSE